MVGIREGETEEKGEKEEYEWKDGKRKQERRLNRKMGKRE